MALSLAVRPIRKAVRSYIAAPGIAVSVIMAASLLAMLIGATAVFGDKFDYVGLDRYYTAVKPLYFLLFVAPVMLIPRRFMRAALCVGLLIGSSWLVQQEWPRPYKRWLAADREVTPSGQWARAFTPSAAQLYYWLSEQDAPNLIVVSNFHEYIALETGIPALPIPKDTKVLEGWVERICESRGVSDPRVLFVLDPDNRTRDYWIPDPKEIVRTFGLSQPADVPVEISAEVLTYQSGTRT